MGRVHGQRGLAKSYRGGHHRDADRAEVDYIGPQGTREHDRRQLGIPFLTRLTDTAELVRLRQQTGTAPTAPPDPGAGRQGAGVVAVQADPD